MAPTDHSTRREKIDRLEALGELVPHCPGCQIFYEALDPLKVFAPSHRALGDCESGGRPHCVCPICWG